MAILFINDEAFPGLYRSISDPNPRLFLLQLNGSPHAIQLDACEDFPAFTCTKLRAGPIAYGHYLTMPSIRCSLEKGKITDPKQTLGAFIHHRGRAGFKCLTPEGRTKIFWIDADRKISRDDRMVARKWQLVLCSESDESVDESQNGEVLFESHPELTLPDISEPLANSNAGQPTSAADK